MDHLFLLVLLTCTSLLSVLAQDGSNSNNDQQSQDSSDATIIRYVQPLNSRGLTHDKNVSNPIECFRCNHFKGGGSPCPEVLDQVPGREVPGAPPANLVVKNCAVCLKVTTLHEFRNKDYIIDKLMVQSIPPYQDYKVISRVCIEDKSDARVLDGCIKQAALGGYVERCYCSKSLCNAASGVDGSMFTLAVFTIAAFLLSFF